MEASPYTKLFISHLGGKWWKQTVNKPRGKKKKNKAKTQVNVKQAPRAEAGRCRTLPPGAGPGRRAAATPSDKVSGDPKGVGWAVVLERRTLGGRGC